MSDNPNNKQRGPFDVEQKGSGFAKKIDANETEKYNFGWRGAEGGFQQKTEDMNASDIFGAHRKDINPTSGASVGHININKINAQKVNINGAYDGKVNINESDIGYNGGIGRGSASGTAHVESITSYDQLRAHNVLSNEKFAELYRNSSPTSSINVSGDYGINIQISSGSQTSKINVNGGDFAGDIGGFNYQRNLSSVQSKLGGRGTNLGRLSQNELQNLIQNKRLRGRNIQLSNNEINALKKYSKTDFQSRSFGTSEYAQKYLSKLKFGGSTGVAVSSTDASAKAWTNVVTTKKDTAYNAKVSETGRIEHKANAASDFDAKQQDAINAEMEKSKLKIVSERSAMAGGASDSSNINVGNSSIYSRFQSISKKTPFRGTINGTLTGMPENAFGTRNSSGTNGHILSKFAKSLFAKKMLGSKAGGIMGGGLFNSFSTGGIGGNSPFIKILLILGVLSVVITTDFHTTNQIKTLIPGSNVNPEHYSEAGGIASVTSNLQRSVDYIHALQDAFEKNLVFCDTETKHPEKEHPSGKVDLTMIPYEKYCEVKIPGEEPEKVKLLSGEKVIEYGYGTPKNWKNQIEGDGPGNRPAWWPECEDENGEESLTKVYAKLEDEILPCFIGYDMQHYWGPDSCFYRSEEKVHYAVLTPARDEIHDEDGNLVGYSDYYIKISDGYNTDSKPVVYCVGGLEGNIGGIYTGELTLYGNEKTPNVRNLYDPTYVGAEEPPVIGKSDDGSKFPVADKIKCEESHVKHESEGYKKLKQINGLLGKKEESTKINHDITVDYSYRGCHYSFMTKGGENNLDPKETYFTSDGIEVDYSMYEMYRALVASVNIYTNNEYIGMDEDGNLSDGFEFYKQYLEDRFMTNVETAKIEIRPTNKLKLEPFKSTDNGTISEFQSAFFEQDDKEVEFTYQDPVAVWAAANGGNVPRECLSVQTVHAKSYKCKATIQITYGQGNSAALHHGGTLTKTNGCGLQDIMRMDTRTNNESKYESLGSFTKKLKDTIHGHTWTEWIKNDPNITEEDRKNGEYLGRNRPSAIGDGLSSFMEWAVMLVDLCKEDFDAYYEGLSLPTSSILEDIVLDEDIDDPGDPPGMIGGGGAGGGTAGQLERPDIGEGVILDNLVYASQYDGVYPPNTKVRYTRDDGTYSYFNNSACLDTSIMMIYFHYYHDCSGIGAADFRSLWEQYFEPNIFQGSGSLNTSYVISQLGLTASGANKVSLPGGGWSVADIGRVYDSLVMGNPVLLHVDGSYTGSGLEHPSSNGHFLIIVGCSDKGMVVYDPGKKSNTNKVIAWDDPCWQRLNASAHGGLYYKIYGRADGQQGTVSVQQKYDAQPDTPYALNSYNGVAWYNGHKETYYGTLNLKGNAINQLWNSQVVGTNLPGAQFDLARDSWISGDGLKMVGDYIAVAADTRRYQRGSIVETSLGPGIIVDHCEAAEAYSCPFYDVAVTW